jgi:hypothetical protein
VVRYVELYSLGDARDLGRRPTRCSIVSEPARTSNARPTNSRSGAGRYDLATPGELHKEADVQTLDEMLSRSLLTLAQHGEIAAWIAHARTPEGIRRMPAPLWRTLELASVLMDVDADLTQAPLMRDEG